MKTRTTLIALSFAVIVMIAGMIGCSSDSKEENKGFVSEVLDTMTQTVSEGVADAVVKKVNQEPAVEQTDEKVAMEPADIVPHFSDFIVNGNKMYVVASNRFVVYDFKDKSQETFRVEDNLNAVTSHDGAIYAGGKSLYKLNDTTLEFVDDQFDGVITDLYSYGYQLMIGTESGLYSRGIFGKEKLLDDYTITAMTSDQSGLWVGTQGEGLYRWDGEKFQKRYLQRDSSLFDFVNSVDFQHNHLYLGCDNGMYIYNGGSWVTLTTEDGLPDNNVRAIDASDWTVYIGTDKGVVSYFNDELKPVNKLENTQVNVIKVRGRRILAATEYDGIIEKKGNVITTLIPLEHKSSIDLLSLLP